MTENRLRHQPLFKILFGGRWRRLFWFFWIALAIVYVVGYRIFFEVLLPRPITSYSDKHLIEWGWNTPRLQDMEDHIEAAQSTPFDGLIIDVASEYDSRGLSWTLFGNQPVDQQNISNLIDEYVDFDWGRLEHNFLRITLSPANVDWFEDFDIILTNLETVARLAQKLGFKGVMFDTEQYGDIHIFDYRQLALSGKSFADYEAQIYQGGQKIMQALNQGYPGLTVLFTFGLSTTTIASNIGDLENFEYGLLKNFIEGMIAGADDETILIDAFEHAYTYRQRDQFALAYKLISDSGQGRLQAGFGLWLDHNECNEPSLIPTNCATGFTPETFRQAVSFALEYSDTYVWIYSQSVDWYSGEGIPEDWHSTLFNIG